MSARSWIAVVAVLATALIVGIGIWLGAAMGVLALGALALVLVLAFLWQSIAALFGQGDRLAEESLWLAVPSGETEQKRAVLRALKDLAFERNVGKVNAEDHALLAARYREEAKRLLRQEDTQAQEWTRLAEAHLAEQHSAEAHAAAADAPSTVGGPARTLLLIVVAGAGLAGILGGMGGMGASTAYAQEAPGGGHTWYQRPADQSVVEAALPIGTLKVELRGAQGQALPQQPMRLITTHASISQGTSTTTRDLESDAAGDAQVEGLGFGSSNEYKVEVLHDGGRFMSAPFQLSDQSGQRVRLHAFKTSTDLRSLLVGMQGSCSLTFKEGKLQVDHLYEMVNLGDHAWVANAPVAVPADAVAITVRSEMATAEFVRQGDGLVLKGTLGPGLGRASFSYQIPLLGSSARISYWAFRHAWHKCRSPWRRGLAWHFRWQTFHRHNGVSLETVAASW